MGADVSSSPTPREDRVCHHCLTISLESGNLVDTGNPLDQLVRDASPFKKRTQTKAAATGNPANANGAWLCTANVMRLEQLSLDWLLLYQLLIGTSDV
jgi:hypothetical protein